MKISELLEIILLSIYLRNTVMSHVRGGNGQLRHVHKTGNVAAAGITSNFFRLVAISLHDLGEPPRIMKRCNISVKIRVET